MPERGVGAPALRVTVTLTHIDTGTVDIQTDWRSMISLIMCMTYEMSGILDQDGVKVTEMQIRSIY